MLSDDEIERCENFARELVAHYSNGETMNDDAKWRFNLNQGGHCLLHIVHADHAISAPGCALHGGSVGCDRGVFEEACRPYAQHRRCARRSNRGEQNVGRWSRVKPPPAGRATPGNVCRLSVNFEQKRVGLETDPAHVADQIVLPVGERQ